MGKESGEITGDAIWVSIGLTKNLGNYESLRVDAGARVSIDDINDDAAWESVWNKVDEQLTTQIEEADNQLEGK